MNSISKRILSILLVVVMCLTTLPATAFAQTATEPSTEPAPVCNCGTDDESIHATTCAVYVVPENPECYCVEKCAEPNEWCDVCGFDIAMCSGEDMAVTYEQYQAVIPITVVGDATAKAKGGVYARVYVDMPGFGLVNYGDGREDMVDGKIHIPYPSGWPLCSFFLYSIPVEGYSVTMTGATEGAYYGDVYPKSVTVTYTSALTEIVATTQPAKKSYVAGEKFDPAGMIITARYANGIQKQVTGYTVTNGNSLTAGQTSVTISYTENGITKTINIPIQVTDMYTVTISSAIQNGTVRADVTKAAKGETITLTVTPAKGYVLESLTVGNANVTAKVVNNTYTFTMPAGNVTIEATFKLCDHNTYKDGKCALCGTVCTHTGGTATCTNQAVCQKCGERYGEFNKDNHTGTCTNGFFNCCSGYESAVQNAQGVYEIGNAGQLFWFAQQVGSGKSNINGKLTADIDLKNKAWTPIGNSTIAYGGTFDGAGFEIKNFAMNITAKGDHGLFGFVKNATIKNFTIYGEVTSTLTAKPDDFKYGVIAEAAGNTMITDVHSHVNLTINDNYFRNFVGGILGRINDAGENFAIERCSFSGTLDLGSAQVDCTGGIVAYIYANNIVKLNNCLFDGEIISEYNSAMQIGGLMGYYRGSGLTITNSLSIGDITVNSNTYMGAIVGILREHSSANDMVKNNYYLAGNQPFGNSTTNTEITDGYGSQTVAGSATAATEAQLKSGETAYKLGSAWGQTIETDETPVLGGAKVYYGYTSCAEDSVAGYTNDANASPEKPDHDWKDGVCQNGCGDIHSPHTGGTATYNGDGTHKVTCSDCGETVTEREACSVDLATGKCVACGTQFQASLTMSGVTTYYENVGNAISVARKSTDKSTRLTLLDDLNSWISISGGTFTLDLNGHSIQNSGSEAAVNIDGANVEITGNGTVKGYYSVSARNGSVLISGGTYQATGTTINYSKAAVTITGGTFEGRSVVFYNNLSGNKDLPVLSGGTFPKGIVIGLDIPVPISDLLAPGYCYWQDGSVLVTGNATSITGSVTVVQCDHSEGLEDAPYTGNGDGTHNKSCATCGMAVVENEACSGGTATCTEKAVCTVCGEEYGEVDSDNHTGNYAVEYQWHPYDDGTCYVNADLFCVDCEDWIDYDSGDAEQTDSVEATDCQNPGSVTYSITLTLNGQEYTSSETFEVKSDNHVGQFENGFCSACGGYQMPELDLGEDPEWENDDVFLIYNAGQLFWFADYVNNVSNEIDVKLMDNIVVPEGMTWTPIIDFYGTFDGNFKTVSGLNATGETNVGMFGGGGYARGTIKNLGLTNSHFEGTSNVGGIAGYHEGTIENCYVDGSVTVAGSSMTGMLVGNNAGTLRNCYAYGGSLVGFMYPGYGSIENCYFLSDTEDSFDGTTAMTAEAFASGEVAYLLQGEQESHVWGQTCGTDAYPTLGGAKVYWVTDCKGNPAYSNTNVSGKHIDADRNGLCDLCGEEISSGVDSWNLSLHGDIRVNFLLKLASEDAAVEITVDGESFRFTASDMSMEGDLYKATVAIAAAQMTQPITVKILEGGETKFTETYTVRQYCDTILANEFYSRYHTLVKEMLNYGGAAQIYFDYDAENPANDGITGVAAQDVPETAEELVVSDSISGLNFYGASLVYRDRIAVRFYFTGDVTGCTFTANGNTYTPVPKDGMYYIEIADILPQNLDQQITLTVTDANGNALSATYGPMNYIVRMNEKGSAALQNLVKALYNYHLAAKAI